MLYDKNRRVSVTNQWPGQEKTNVEQNREIEF